MALFGNGILGGDSLFNKLIGGAIGAYYGNKNGNFMDGLMGGYAGFQKPSSLYDRIMGNYLPNQSIVKLEDNRGV